MSTQCFIWKYFNSRYIPDHWDNITYPQKHNAVMYNFLQCLYRCMGIGKIAQGKEWHEIKNLKAIASCINQCFPPKLEMKGLHSGPFLIYWVCL